MNPVTYHYRMECALGGASLSFAHESYLSGFAGVTVVGSPDHKLPD
jgi:hypothetical protein